MNLSREQENEIIRSAVLDGKKPNEIAHDIGVLPVKIRSYLVELGLADKLLVDRAKLDRLEMEVYDEF